MGNCFNKHAVVSWTDDDDWDWSSAGEAAAEKEGLLEGSKEEHPPSKEVKIKVTRKQLEELLRRAGGGHGANLQEVLTCLSSEDGGGAACLDDHHSHWRPALQSIPEGAE